MPADEALIALTEAVLFAGLLALTWMLWAAHHDPYPQLVAQLVNSSSSSAEILYVLPKPVRVEGNGSYGRVCQAGECYPVIPIAVTGRAVNWLVVYKAHYATASGAHQSPAPTTILTVQIYEVSSTGAILSSVEGVSVRINGVIYVTNSSGRISARVLSGVYHLVEVLSNGYTFLCWSDGDSSSSKTVKVEGFTTLTAFVSSNP